MKKSMLYIGLILIVVGIAVGLIAPGSVVPSLFPKPTTQSIVVAAKSIGYLPILLNESGLPILTFNSSTKLDFYLANATAYALLAGAAAPNSSIRGAAAGLEGRGVYEVYENSSSGAFPFIGYPNVTAPLYLLNVTSLQPGTYYAMFYNMHNATASVEVTSASVSISKIQSGEASVGEYLGVAALLFIAGIGLSIYAVISKDRSKEQATIDQEAEKEYKRIEKQGRGGRGK